MRLTILVVALLVVSFVPIPAQQAPVALRFGTVVTGLGQSVSDGVIVVEGDRIKSVGTGNRAVPAGATVIDLRPFTAIPGLIDAHTHMTYYWDPASGTTPLNQPRREPAETATLAAANAIAHVARRCHDGARSRRVGRRRTT